ncbi:hypothetical protein TNCV_2100891 [Trichonephila clavipes]|nr:hypothetical protein TNCV_2100891 [Trichonephila clavipes]
MNVCGNEITDGLTIEGSHKDSRMVAALPFQKLLHESNEISVPLISRPPYMSDMKETMLVLLCLGHAVVEIKILLLCFPVDILDLNGTRWFVKFTLLVQIAM